MPGSGLGRKRWWVRAAVGLIALSLVGYTFALHLREDLEFAPGSFAYYVLVARHREVRQFAALAAQDPPRFEYDAADGNAPARITATFRASASPVKVREAYAELCRAQGYGPTVGADAIRCQTAKWDITVQATDQGRGASVVVAWEER